jgi:hypothetical protein
METTKACKLSPRSWHSFSRKKGLGGSSWTFGTIPGGDFGLGRWYIIRTVMRSSHLLTRGRLFVATDRSSFSAAFINALDFRREANAILVGEPPESARGGIAMARVTSFLGPACWPASRPASTV